MSLRELLERFSAGLGERLADQPLVEGAIRYTIGKAFNALGEYDEATQHLKRAKEIGQEHLGEDHVTTIDTEVNGMNQASKNGVKINGGTI